MIDATELLSWYGREQRDLPWRRPGVTPWQILVSEFMLQQTPVARVEPIWLDWIARWPTPSATASASAADVLRAWGKLGYPRRAKRLHECAIAIAADHDDEVPSDVETLLSLPGIGTYTARAIACFAYRQRVPVVDTNVRRVIARAVHGRADASASSSPRDLVDVEALLPNSDEAPTFSVALMELGATVCTAKSPLCEACPIAGKCAFLRNGRPGLGQRRTRPRQRFQGTDRQVRGLVLNALRGLPDGETVLDRKSAERLWKDHVQLDKCIASLDEDGLIEILPGGGVRLPV